MRLNDIPRILLRYAVLIIAVAVAVTASMFALAKSSQTYSATSSVTVVGTYTPQGKEGTTLTEFIISEMSVYEALALSSETIERASKISDVRVTPESVASAASVETKGQVITFKVKSGDPQKATSMATALSRALAEAINALHANQAPIKATAVMRLPSESPLKASGTSRSLVTGALLGLILGAAAALLLHLLRGRVGSAHELAGRTDARVFGPFSLGDEGSQLEAARRIHASIEKDLGAVSDPLLSITCATADSLPKPLAAALSRAFSEAGTVTNVSEVTADATDLPTRGQGVSIITSPPIAESSVPVRVASHADGVLLAVSPREKASVVLSSGDALRRANAEFLGYVLLKN